jgi:hypothetical protein
MSSQKSMIYEILKMPQTVFTMPMLCQITGEGDANRLSHRINYYVRKGILNNPRKGIYTKEEYDKLEMACSVYVPCYISLQYVLQKSGVIFQYDSGISVVSYLSREIEIEGQRYTFRKIKSEIISDTRGIEVGGSVSMASTERAALDTLYLYPNFVFDNIGALDKAKVMELLPIYGSKVLEKRVEELFR